MTKRVNGRAEIALEYPDKLYIGTFEHTAYFDAHLDEAGISLSLTQSGSADVRKAVRMHFHYAVFAEILGELAKTVATTRPADTAQRDALKDGAHALHAALEATKRPEPRETDGKGSDGAQMTAEEAVLLLHVME